jgi:hypothetical protein
MRKNLFLFFLFITTAFFAQNADTASQSDPAINHCISVVEDVESKGNIIGQLNLDSLGQLPIGIAKDIGSYQVIIAIDSSSFYPNKATFNAYAAIDFPGSADKIAFRAQNIEFNPKGIIGGDMARLVLVSNHRIRINPNVTLVLKAYDNNYVKWNCNGFEKVHLKGYFEFSKNIILPDSTSPNTVGTGDVVTASFEIETTDIHNFIAQVSISPFVLKNVKDVSILDATVDMSEFANSQNMNFPAGYNFNGTTPNMWQGFYLKQLKVKLPKALSQKNQDRKEITVSDFLIDNTGVSGKFQVSNVLSVGQGDMSGWGFSVTQLGITILQNHLNGGNIAGELEIPISDETKFGYQATISENPNTKETDFQFTINPKNGVKANLFSATLNLYNTSSITVTKVGAKFKPEANLNGIITFNSANFKGANLKFQDIHIITERPVFIGGTFAYTSANQTGSASNVNSNSDSVSTNNTAAGFKIGINEIAFQFSQNTPPKIYVNVGLQFIQEDDGGGLGATCGLLVKTKYQESFQGDGSVLELDKLQFDKIQITDISIDVSTSAFALKGYVIFFDNDPTFGKGFMGGVNLNIKSAGVLVDINAAFGSKTTYKYFYVDGAVKLPNAIPICYALGLWGFQGGLYYHMRPIITQPLKDGMVNLMQSSQATLAMKRIPYYPDSTSAIGFKAGIMFGLMGKDDIFNGDIELELQFNTNGGLDLIRLKGDVALMCSINDKATKPADQIPVHGTTDVYYDFINSTFHMTNTITFNLVGALSGGGQNVIHFEPGKWYVYVGKPSARVNINVYDLVNITSYFMVGSEVEPMPPPPSYVNVAYGDGRNMQAVSAGNGFVAGAALQVDIDGQFGWDFFNVYYYLHAGVGFDIMLGKYKAPWHCDGRSGTPGVKGWFAQGQVWMYVSGGVGVRGDITILGIDNSFDFTIASINLAAILAGKAPNPVYFEGAVHADYNILSVVKGGVDFNFHAGTDCVLTQ